MIDARARFRKLFVGWVDAHNRAKGMTADPDDLLQQLDARISKDLQSQIGAAFLNGWLIADSRNGHEHGVREAERPGLGGSHYTVYHAGKGVTVPWWELYVQLADYSQVRGAAEGRGLTVRLEDNLMDIAVWAGSSLLLYIENKVAKSEAITLVRGMGEYGAKGFDLDDNDKGNDPLRKAKYLFRGTSRPEYFAVSAIDYQELFLIEYLGDRNRFSLVPQIGTILSPILTAMASGKPPPLRPTDLLVSHLYQLVRNRLWTSPGTGRTAVNIYLPSSNGDCIAIGVYESGETWTDTKALGLPLAQRLAQRLLPLGVTLDVEKQGTFWKTTSGRFTLDASNAEAVAEAIADAFAS